MAVFKCTWFFEGMQQQTGRTASSMVGWTETWYRDFAEGIEQAITEMRRTDANTWLNARLGAMHGLYRCRWVRASSVDTTRLTKTASVPGDAHGRLGVENDEARLLIVAGGNTTAAQITCALLVDFVCPPAIPGDRNHHRRYLIRGLHNAMIAGNNVVETSPSFTAMLRFCDYVGRGEAPAPANRPNPVWWIRHADPALPFVPITSLIPNAGNARQIDLGAALGALPQGARVIVRGAGLPVGVNRTWTSRTAQGAPPYVLGTARKPIAGTWDGRGTCQVARYLYRAATQYLVIGLRHKAIGRPFNLTRGRRRIL